MARTGREDYGVWRSDSIESILRVLLGRNHCAVLRTDTYPSLTTSVAARGSASAVTTDLSFAQLVTADNIPRRREVQAVPL
jgi:hypothetical protein